MLLYGVITVTARVYKVYLSEETGGRIFIDVETAMHLPC